MWLFRYFPAYQLWLAHCYFCSILPVILSASHGNQATKCLACSYFVLTPIWWVTAASYLERSTPLLAHLKVYPELRYSKLLDIVDILSLLLVYDVTIRFANDVTIHPPITSHLTSLVTSHYAMPIMPPRGQILKSRQD